MRSWNIFWHSLISHIRLTLARPTYQIVLVLQPIVMSTITYMIYRKTSSYQNILNFVVLGSGISGMWSSIVFSSAGDISRERNYGTLPSIIIAPGSFILVMLGKIVANGILSVSSLLISIAFSVIILGTPITIGNIFIFLVALVLFIISTNMFALMLSSIFFLSRSTAVLQNFLEYPILLITGVLFSTDILPGWVRLFGLPIPLTWGAQLLRLSVLSDWKSDAFYTALGILSSLCGFYLFASVVLFSIIERRVRILANLDIY